MINRDTRSSILILVSLPRPALHGPAIRADIKALFWAILRAPHYSNLSINVKKWCYARFAAYAAYSDRARDESYRRETLLLDHGTSTPVAMKRKDILSTAERVGASMQPRPEFPFCKAAHLDSHLTKSDLTSPAGSTRYSRFRGNSCASSASALLP
jgi:hypothetical protein